MRYSTYFYYGQYQCILVHTSAGTVLYGYKYSIRNRLGRMTFVGRRPFTFSIISSGKVHSTISLGRDHGTVQYIPPTCTTGTQTLPVDSLRAEAVMRNTNKYLYRKTTSTCTGIQQVLYRLSCIP